MIHKGYHLDIYLFDLSRVKNFRRNMFNIKHMHTNTSRCRATICCLHQTLYTTISVKLTSHLKVCLPPKKWSHTNTRLISHKSLRCKRMNILLKTASKKDLITLNFNCQNSLVTKSLKPRRENFFITYWYKLAKLNFANDYFLYVWFCLCFSTDWKA